MKISCICATYNRFPIRSYLLEESVQSFLQQSYEDKELIIVNDCPQQELAFEHEQVTVVNLPRRCRNLGEKYNLAVTMASGDYIAPWDDDDISLPMRLAKAADMLKRTGSHYYKPAGQWFLDSRGIGKLQSFVGHNSSVYSYKAFVKVNGYPSTSWGADTELDRKLKSLGPNAIGEVTVYDWQYIYRWGVSDLHLSSIHDEADREKAWKAAANKPVVPGKYTLAPKWLYDYSRHAQIIAKSGLSVYPIPDMEFWQR